MPARIAMTLGAIALSAPIAQAQEWMLLSRESGCVSLQVLVKMEKLPQTPASPDDFAAMMRARHPSVTMALPDGFPREMNGRAVMVKYAGNRAPVFLRADLCPRDGGM